jgi:hypothetical protein
MDIPKRIVDMAKIPKTDASNQPGLFPLNAHLNVRSYPDFNLQHPI